VFTQQVLGGSSAISDPRPRTAGADIPWPLIGAVLAHAAGQDIITFTVSDIAPDHDISPVELGINLFSGGADTVITVSARFARAEKSVFLRIGNAPVVALDAVISFRENTVIVVTRLPLTWDVLTPRERDRCFAFCTIQGVRYQTDVPAAVVAPVPSPHVDR
jgi:hypothetical protein